MYINIDLDVLDSKILEVLESNGFSKDDMGTFFYKEVIKNVVIELVDCTEESDLNRLRTQISSQYSAFYYNIIEKLNRLDIVIFRDMEIFCKLEMFHNYIIEAFSRSNIVVKNNIAVSNRTSSISIDELNNRRKRAMQLYKHMAFCLASYMLSCIEDNIEEFRNKDAKVLALKRDSNK